ncbi:uncharacterized protein LOC133876865 [Alnus glutinosa]|uniref:uncharacterized protein LOC133876865 n=1 Tax=Alnus glutinosa TaxID=3517 RepID=UPI002D79886B|nr:uncharacterized protein LOC133876865 [Alnus glutinosa]
MDNGSYNIKESLLVVKPWPPELAFEEVDLSSCAFWVQVHGLPLQNMMVVNAIKIGKLIGLKVLTIEDGDKPGIINHHHLRFRLLIDVSLPLAPGFHLPRNGRSPLWIKLLYKRLANYCALCGCIGHCKMFCPAPPPLGTPDRYSTSLQGYVYPSSRKLVSARPASGCVSSASATSPINGLPPSLVPLKLEEEASLPTESRPQSPSLSPVMPNYPHASLPDIPYSSPSSYNSPPIYSPIKPPPTKKSPSPRLSIRHHPYLPKTQVLVLRGRAPVSEVYPSPLLESRTISGHKRVAVSEVSDLFSPPSKKLSNPHSLRDRMLFAAQSLTHMRNSPPAPVTPGTSPEFSLAASSPGLQEHISAAPPKPLSPTIAKKFHKAARKSRSVTQLVLVDEVSHVDARVDVPTSASFEAAGSAMPPPVSPSGSKGGFLLAWKTNINIASLILNQLGFVMMIQASPSGSKGGLLLAWKTDIDIASLFVSSNIISVWYYSVDPTICIGDFNAISSFDDKLGGRPFDYFSFNPLNDFMDAFGMVDLSFSGNSFTWSNHRQGFDLIKERLDRSIANSYFVTHLPAHNSNHNHLLLDTSIPSPSLPRPFRFEEFWTRDPTCGSVIEEAWFFHTSTLIRRRQNSINLLQSPRGGWITDRFAIGDCFINNFKSLFASSNPSPDEELLSLFDNVISDEDNNLLSVLPAKSEIYDSLTSLGSVKAPGPDGFTTAFVPGRHIHDNSILAHEMLHTLKFKRGNDRLMAVNIDMEKAFDRME